MVLKNEIPHKKSTIGIVIEKYPNVALTKNLEKCAPETPSQFCISTLLLKAEKKSLKNVVRFASSLLSKVITLKKRIIEMIIRNNPSICFLLFEVKVK